MQIKWNSNDFTLFDVIFEKRKASDFYADGHRVQIISELVIKVCRAVTADKINQIEKPRSR